MVEAGRLPVTVPAPLAFAVHDQVGGIAPCLKLSIGLDDDMERTAVGEADVRVHPYARKIARRLHLHRDWAVRRDSGGAETIEPTGYPDGRSLGTPHVGGEHGLPTGQDLVCRPSLVPGVEVLGLL